MPIAHFHVVDPTPEQQRELLVRGSQGYAEAFESPIDRVRVFVHSYPANAAAVGGVPVSEGAGPAPFFTALAMGGRPIEQHHRVLRLFTDLIVDVMGVDASVVRGWVTAVDPDSWSIAGEPAAQVRAAEIAARAGGSKPS